RKTPPPPPPPAPKVVKKEVPQVKAPPVEEIPIPVVQEVVKKEVPKVVPPANPVVAQPTPPPAPSPTIDQSQYQLLFEQKEAKELSDKLAETPIRDLTKAISINEKILTVQELFDKDNQAFGKAIQKLNEYKSFEEAKPFLTQLANQYDWTEKGRKKKAKVFIKLIRRRYK
ncbi:MAG: hypothetical protein AAGD05_18975, partial [Bacteroidota bacterium]